MIKVITHVAKAIVAIATALLFFSCGFEANFKSMDGSGNVVTKERKLTGDYKAISAGRGIEVVIEQGDSYAVIVEADDNLQSHITTKVEGGELEISADVNIRNATSKKVIVKLPHIESIEASSGSRITGRSTFKNELMDLSTSSDGTIDVAIDVNNATFEASSGSHIIVKGKAGNVETSSSSGAGINARELSAKKVKAEASSGGHTYVNPSESLLAEASSGGEIYYIKTLESLDKDTSSGGKVAQE